MHAHVTGVTDVVSARSVPIMRRLVAYSTIFMYRTPSTKLRPNCDLEIWLGVTRCHGRLKAYLIYLVAKNQSFRNKSRKAQPIRAKFGARGHVKG